MMFQYYLLNKKQQSFYKVLRQAIGNLDNLIPIYGHPVLEINTIIKALLTDYPDFFWFEGKWEIIKNDSETFIKPLYTYNRNQSNEIYHQICDYVEKSFVNAVVGMSVFEKVKMAYDWVLLNADYGTANGNGQTIYDAIINRVAVCKGLSKTFQFLLNRINLFSTLREGTLDGVTKHVWNVVEVDKKYYNVDISLGYDKFSYIFDEEKEYNPYRSFLISDVQLKKTNKFYKNTLLKCDCDYIGDNEI